MQAQVQHLMYDAENENIIFQKSTGMSGSESWNIFKDGD